MAGKQNADILIENGTVVTVDPQRRVIRNGAVAVVKNKIKEVGKASALRKKYSPKKKYDATNKLIMPGLINCHIHFYHHMHRGLSPETLAGMPWSDFVHRRVATIVRAEDEIWGGLGILVETLKTGATTFLEAGSYNIDKVIEGVSRIGMRGLMGRRSFDFVSQGHNMLVDSTKKCLKENERFFKKYRNGVDLVKPCIVVVGMGRCSDELYKKSKAMADKYGTILHMHMSNMIEKRPGKSLEERGAAHRAPLQSGCSRQKRCPGPHGSCQPGRDRNAGRDGNQRPALPEHGDEDQLRPLPPSGSFPK